MIYILQHGETEWNVADIYQGLKSSPFTERGREQIRKAAQYFTDKNIEKLFSSPLERAVETAKVISETIGIDIEIIPSFYEIDCGSFEGKPRQIYKKEKGIEPRFPNGESFADVYKRVEKDVERLASLPKNILIVGHGGTNRVIASIITNTPFHVIEKQKHTKVICCEKNSPMIYIPVA
ncbi:MAG: histidine phosphatase family protein [Candidatus Peribacteraceae bacterium]|nr:histidine phosphatase family protein [Candidatus Peribacteraceae bacterium]